MVNSARFAKTHALSTGKLGVTGFCWGGSTTNFLAVTLGPDLQAGVPFYGGAPETARVASIKAPLLIQYAETDERVNAMWPAYESALKAGTIQYQAYIYPGTQHGLHNNSTPRYRGGGGQAGLGADDRVLQEATWPEDQRDRERQQHAHGDVEDPESAAVVQDALGRGAERQPDEAARQRGQHEEAAQPGGLNDRVASLRLQKRPGRARRGEPGFRVDPLKHRGADVAHRVLVRRCVDAARVAIFQESTAGAAPPQWMPEHQRIASTRLPSPSGTRNIISPMPVDTPKRQGSPLRMPALAPAAVSMTLLGPGVTAATTAKRRNGAACVVLYLPDASP
jgi:dienelactone hydrolase